MCGYNNVEVLCCSCQSDALRLESFLTFSTWLNSVTTDSSSQHHKGFGHVCERWGSGGQTTKEAHVKLQRSLFLQPAGVRNNIVEDRSVWPKKALFFFWNSCLI